VHNLGTILESVQINRLFKKLLSLTGEPDHYFFHRPGWSLPSDRGSRFTGGRSQKSSRSTRRLYEGKGIHTVNISLRI